MRLLRHHHNLFPLWTAGTRVLPVVFLGVFAVGCLGTALHLNLRGAAESRRQTAAADALAGHIQRSVLEAALAAGDHPLDATLSGPGQAEAVAAWRGRHAAYLDPSYRPGTWSGVRAPGAPVLLSDDGSRAVIVMAPFMAVEGRPLLPVLVKTSSPAGGDLRLLDLAHLLAVQNIPSSLRVSDETGRALLTTQAAVFGTAVRRPGTALPFQIMIAEENATPRRALVAGLGLTLLLASLGTWFAGRLLRRSGHGAGLGLDDLVDHMAQLAKGDHALRLPTDPEGEMGDLAGGFNEVARRMESVQREVGEKTVHLRAALENMKLLDKAKDDFLVLISHEVRTPLTVIIGSVDYLRSSLANLSEDQRSAVADLNLEQIVTAISSSTDRLSGFMDDAIQMTAMQSNDRKLDLNPVPVSHVLDACLSDVEDAAREGGVALDNRLAEAADWTILADVNLLKLALGKLLDNAVRHNRSGGVVRVAEVTEIPDWGTVDDLLAPEGLNRLTGQESYRRWERESIRWRLVEVFNTGVPIPPDKMKALFGRFELVGGIKHHKKGTGLSLPLAQSAVECHGGRIICQAHPTDGNSFYFLLPTFDGNPSRAQESTSGLWDDFPQGLGGTAWHEKVGQVADPASLKIEFDDHGAAVAGGIDESGRGVDGAGGTHDEEEITSGGRLE